MKVIIVTGTPGTGKTTVAKKLAEDKGLKYIDAKGIIKKKRLSESYDRKRACMVVDTDKLNSELIALIGKYREEGKTNGLVIDSHLSQYLPKEYVTLCIVTKCSLTELKKRLEKRRYSRAKVRENLDAEIFDTCRIEALEAGHKVKTVYTDKR